MKDYVEELQTYKFDRMYDLPSNKYLLITMDEIWIEANIHGSSVELFIDSSPIKDVVCASFNNKVVLFVDKYGELYNRYKISLSKDYLSAQIGPECIIAIDSFGYIERREISDGRFETIKIPEPIKTVAFADSSPVFLSYTGNIYYQANKYTDPILVTSDINEIYEIFEGVLLVNNEETKIINSIGDFELNPYKFNYSDINL